MVVLLKALPQVVVLLSLFFTSIMLNEWPTDLGWLILATIQPDKSQHNRGGRFDRQACQECNPGKRLINGLRQFRRIAACYEKRDAEECYEHIPALVSWVN